MWRWYPARRSVPRATSGSPARSATTTWSRASAGWASCSARPAEAWCTDSGDDAAVGGPDPPAGGRVTGGRVTGGRVTGGPASGGPASGGSAQGAPAPALHRGDAARHAGRAGGQARDPAARGADRGLAAAAVRRRRAGLVPLPAALRHGPLGAAHPGGRVPAAAGNGAGRAGRGIGLAGDPDRPLGVRAAVRRPDPRG